MSTIELQLEPGKEPISISAEGYAETMVKAIACNYTDTLECNAIHALIACMPKSGSTFLKACLAKLPSMQDISLVCGFGNREQELSTELCLLFHQYNYVAQHHTKYSDITGKLLNMFSIKPIVIVRNIFDIIVSMSDFIAEKHSNRPFIPHDFYSYNPEQRFDFVITMFIPWYINFYTSWFNVKDKLLITYEEFIANTSPTIKQIAEYLNMKPLTDNQVAKIINQANQEDTRKNIGIKGRGEFISKRLKAKIYDIAKLYPNIDFSPIGIVS